MTSASWNATLYDESHSFVWKLAGEVLALLDARPGELVLDLGCGTGQLAAQLAERGVRVVGLTFAHMIAGPARSSGIVLELATGRLLRSANASTPFQPRC
jgi:trans-aconitate 2-methyltransferase